MKLLITGRQRDLLYDVVQDRLTGIDRVWWSVQNGEWDDAHRLAREYSNLLRLVVDGLGWGRNHQEAVELRSPPDVLQGALEAIRREVALENPEQMRLRLRAAEAQVDRQHALDACEELLTKLRLSADAQ
ncbi:MAG TPA: hypothetical protein VFP21_00555 [Solirubrobacterales bacterium]|nr:hypothetical protein [Solirubrobacterales bacterium]